MNATKDPVTRRLGLNSPPPNVRLDRYLAQALSEFSRAQLQRLIEQGYVLVNGQRTKASQRLTSSDRITIELPPSPGRPLPEPIPLAVVYEDQDLMIIDKPAGLTVHPAPGHPSHTLVNAILARFPSLTMSNDAMRPGIVHRLDKDTSGLIVIAKDDLAREYLAAQFRRRTVTKGYLVLVRGRLSPEQGIIEAPIGRDPHHRRRMTVMESGKQATTQYQVREYLNRYTLVEVSPITGRTHQIRIHLSAIGYPVVGDPTYGVRSAHLHRQFVHACRLGFRLPSTEQYQEFVSPLPADLEQALQYLARRD
jgi:23S rRNA pseudouridine1911/1915/1917 synthase